MDDLKKVGLSILCATCCLAIIVALENAHRLKESIKERIQVVFFLGTLILAPLWLSREDPGILTIAKMMVLVFGNIALSGILRPPMGPDDSMDLP